MLMKRRTDAPTENTRSSKAVRSNHILEADHPGFKWSDEHKCHVIQAHCASHSVGAPVHDVAPTLERDALENGQQREADVVEIREATVGRRRARAAGVDARPVVWNHRVVGAFAIGRAPICRPCSCLCD